MSFDAVCFDCDSTLSRIEGIDELARRAGLFDACSALTEQAMNGELPLEAVYARRLEMIRPNRAALDWLAELYIAEMTPGALTAVQTLTEQGKNVHIISGGLRQAILPLAAVLGVPDERVHAVDIFLDRQSEYTDFDRASPLAVSGGKARICRRIRLTQPRLAMVGDGKTDLEAKLAGAYMVGFGGVADRPLVRAEADFFIGGPSLADVLAVLS